MHFYTRYGSGMRRDALRRIAAASVGITGREVGGGEGEDTTGPASSQGVVPDCPRLPCLILCLLFMSNNIQLHGKNAFQYISILTLLRKLNHQKVTFYGTLYKYTLTGEGRLPSAS